MDSAKQTAAPGFHAPERESKKKKKKKKKKKERRVKGKRIRGGGGMGAEEVVFWFSQNIRKLNHQKSSSGRLFLCAFM